VAGGCHRDAPKTRATKYWRVFKDKRDAMKLPDKFKEPRFKNRNAVKDKKEIAAAIRLQKLTETR
jgi:hypothetical protein